MENTHYLRLDYRIRSLEYILSGLENTINQLKEVCKIDPIYEESFYIEDVEPIYGLAFIALQNYINSSIFDLFETLDKKEKIYRQDKKVPTYERTRIELIIGLANYLKHRDDDKPFNKGTLVILQHFNLNYNDDLEDGSLPISEGYELLTENYKMSELINVVQEWRENMWVNYEKNH